jgi:hypothetical protein
MTEHGFWERFWTTGCWWTSYPSHRGSMGSGPSRTRLLSCTVLSWKILDGTPALSSRVRRGICTYPGIRPCMKWSLYLLTTFNTSSVSTRTFMVFCDNLASYERRHKPVGHVWDLHHGRDTTLSWNEISKSPCRCLTYRSALSRSHSRYVQMNRNSRTRRLYLHLA